MRLATVAILLVGLAAIGLRGWWLATWSPQELITIGGGIILGLIYIVRGGSLPSWAHRYANVNADDDPANLSYRLYLPILGLVIIVTALLLFFGLKR